MSDGDGKKSFAEEVAEELGAVMEHANQDEHIPECPFYRDKSEGSKTSSGAVSNAYRSGWDATFGKMTIGQA